MSIENELPADVLSAIQENNKIKAIKLLREHRNIELKKADRLIDITKMEGCDNYINPEGGKEIYTKEYFAERGYTDDPKRCKSCHTKLKKSNRSNKSEQFQNEFKYPD